MGTALSNLDLDRSGSGDNQCDSILAVLRSKSWWRFETYARADLLRRGMANVPSDRVEARNPAGASHPSGKFFLGFDRSTPSRNFRGDKLACGRPLRQPWDWVGRYGPLGPTFRRSLTGLYRQNFRAGETLCHPRSGRRIFRRKKR